MALRNTSDTIYSTTPINVEIGLKINNKIEYIPLGTFNIATLKKDDFTIKITAYDNMYKFKMKYSSALGDSATLTQVVNEIAAQIGVKFEGSLPAYNVKKLEGFSCREVLGYIASLCGGNAIIKRNGNFTIVYPTDINREIGEGVFDFTREEVKYKIGKITCQVSDSETLSKGSLGADSMELQFENPWMNATILTDIYNRLNSFEYLGYKIKWQGDPSLDIGDIITYTDDKGVIRKLPIFNRKLSYDGGLDSELSAKGETKNENSSNSSGSMSKKVNRVVTDLAIVNEALIGKANVQDLEASNAKIENLEAKTVKIEEAIIDVAHIKDLNAINANIQNLIAADATINNALIGKADITELNAVKGTINVLESDTANIKNLLAGNISGESGQLIHLTASNVVIADAVIKDLIAANISVGDLKASTISTNKFTIASTDGGLSIVGATMQFKDKNNKVRIQMGQDTQGNFNFILRGADGTTTLIDHTGIKEKAIADNLIKENMVAADAIGEKQINYSSLITGLNKDTNTSLIKASKVAIDLTGQSLEVSFNSLKSNVDNMEIGGRNLILNSKAILLNGSDTGNNNCSIVENDYVKISPINNGNVYNTQVSTSTNRIQGKTYILSFEILTSTTIGFYWYPSENYTRGSYISASSKWQKISFTYTQTGADKNTKTLFGFNGLVGGNTYYYRNLKLEEGNKATTWTSAPEDTDSKIESNTTAITVAQGKIEGLIKESSIIKGNVTTISDKYTSLKATVDGINTTVASNTSSIGTINNNISGLNTKVTTVENKQATLEQNLNGFKTTVANTYSTKSELSGVDGKVSSLTSRVNTAESSITQLNNQIKLKVEATDITNAINNINVGGENLFLNANFAKRYTNNSIGWDNSKNGTTFADSWACYNGGVTNPSTGYHAHLYEKDGEWVARYVNESDKRWKAFSQGLSEYARRQLVPGEKYTFSVDIYSENTGCYLHGGLYSYKKGATSMNFNSGTYGLQPTTLNKWVRMSWTFTVDSGIDLSKSMSWYIYGYQGSVGTIYMKKPQLQRGTKATDFSISQEDNEKSIANVQTQVTTTSNKVATIETNLSSITQRVSSTESTVSTHTSQLSTVDSRINTAKNSAISTAANDATSKANTAQTNAINSAKGYTDGQITTVNQTITNKVAEIKATTDSITSAVSKVEQIATSSLQGKMLFTDPTFKSGLNSIKVYNNSGNGNVVVSRVAKSSECPTTSGYMMQITTKGTASPNHGGFYFGNTSRANAIFVTKIIAKIPSGCTLNWASNATGNGRKSEWLTSNAGTGNWKEYIFKVTCGSSGSFSSTNYFYLSGGSAPVTWCLAFATVFDITETNNIESRMESAEQKITPTAITTTISSVITGGTGSISTTQFVMDKNGLTINNGALRIKNKSGTTVLNSDTNGNLIITGEMRSQYGQQWVGLNAGGLTFQDWNRNEQMLRVGLSYFDSNRDMNGVNFALAKYGDFIRFSHIAKTDLTNGWSSSDAQYNFFDCWSSDQTVGGVSYKKGINVYSPMFVNNGIQLFSGTNYPSEILGAVSWDNGNGTIWNMMGLYGDNGAVLGYKDGSNLKARIVVTEGAHPGTDDKIKSWGHWNCSGYVVHNATFRGSFQNSYANTLTRTFTETHCIEAENKQVRVNFKDIQLKNGKAILNIPSKYMYINTGYIVSSIVKKGKGDVWVSEEKENRFIIEGTEDIKINIEVIINLEDYSLYTSTAKTIDEQPLCVDMSTGQTIGA